MMGRVMTPKYFQNITFGGKGNFADVIRRYELSGKEIILDYPDWPNPVTWSLESEEHF